MRHPARRRPRVCRVGVRAGIVVTGTEVLTGRVPDRNGPWLAEQLRQLGVDVGHIVLVGDRPEDMRGALAFLTGTGVTLVITSGGLGPTADDLTAEVVGEFQGRPSVVDPALEERIAAVVERLMARRGWRADPDATAAGVRKQALVPGGATVLQPVGTAPGLVVPPAEGRDGPTVLVLPGPPAELQGMWPAAVATDPVVRALAGRSELRQETVRLWGTLEVQLAVVLRDARGRAGRPRDHHLHAGRRGGDRHPLRPREAARVRPARRRCSPGPSSARSSRPGRRWTRSSPAASPTAASPSRPGSRARAGCWPPG